MEQRRFSKWPFPLPHPSPAQPSPAQSEEVTPGTYNDRTTDAAAAWRTQ